MAWSGEPVRVRVPATSANLGPGFDALGLALDQRLLLTTFKLSSVLQLVAQSLSGPGFLLAEILLYFSRRRGSATGAAC